jgi:hypothetical protein
MVPRVIRVTAFAAIASAGMCCLGGTALADPAGHTTLDETIQVRGGYAAGDGYQP